MARVHVVLSDTQAAYLSRRAAEKGTTKADAIREAIDAQLRADERQGRIDVALAALGKPAYHSGLHDVAENHDEYIGQALDEEVERWRRG